MIDCARHIDYQYVLVIRKISHTIHLLNHKLLTAYQLVSYYDWPKLVFNFLHGSCTASSPGPSPLSLGTRLDTCSEVKSSNKVYKFL